MTVTELVDGGLVEKEGQECFDLGVCIPVRVNCPPLKALPRSY
jgi:hypothetical protein